MRLLRNLNSLLRKTGWELRRIPTVEPDAHTYYQPVPSCQISGLAHLYEQFLGASPDGFFVEVGAFDGESFSNTSCLAAMGWSGLLIEPVPELADLCRTRYSSNPRVKIIEAAVGSKGGELELTVAGPLTTANEDLADQYREVTWAKSLMEDTRKLVVKQYDLDSLLSSHAVAQEFGVLVVDVEGYEGEVFEGFSLDYWRPCLMIVELSDTHPDLSVTRTADINLSRSIQKQGYEIVYKDTTNTVFARASGHRELRDGGH